MDLLAELETMAQNVPTEEPVSGEDTARWQMLFGFTEREAVRHIEGHRNDYARVRVSDELWAAEQTIKGAEGFDREAYEFSLVHHYQPQSQLHSDSPRPLDLQAVSGSFILQLEWPLDLPTKVQQVADLPEVPTPVNGVGENDESTFVEIDGRTRAKILDWISQNYAGFQPTIVRLSKAKKDLCAHSNAPTLSLDSVLPQHRLNNAETPLPLQNQYPVWYFFYGTLQDPNILTQHLALDGHPGLIPARVQGAQIKTWAGKYKALVDAPDLSTEVYGSAFLVQDREQEDALRFYETDKYVVVRCRIISEDYILPGLTFRFGGRPEELD